MTNISNWAIDLYNATWGSTVSSNNESLPTYLRSEYPYIALPATLYAEFKSQATSAGFVCFPASYAELTVCEIDKGCGYFVNTFETLTLSTNGYG